MLASPSSAPSPTLPVVDMAGLDGDAAQVAAFRENLLRATHEVGFFYLVGHGITEADIEGIFAAAQRFFDLPEDDKLGVEMLRSPQFRGYTRTGGELTQGQVDWREQIDLGAERAAVTDPAAPAYMRLEGPNLWPAAQPELKPVIADWEQRCGAIARRLLQEWAVALGSAPDTFDAAFAEAPSTLIKLIRYPGKDDADAPTSGQGVGAHKDPGVLTLLMVEPGKGGLQVEHRGEWLDAPARPGAFVVNIGELLEVATGGYLKATVHRVVTPAAGETRMSIPFFFNPALASTVPSIDLPPALSAEAAGVTQDPANVISATFGDNLLKARLRAHPDVAAAHHSDLLG